MGELIIEDEDGHVRKYSWPDGVSILHGAAFADLCLADYERWLATDPGWETDEQQ